MVTLEQIKLLESKLTRAINFVGQLTEENSRLKKRNNELEETITSLKEEKARVEEGIVSALGKLNQFEDAIERSLSSVKGNAKSAQQAPASKPVQQTPASKPVQQPSASKPVVPSAYTVDEDTIHGAAAGSDEEKNPGGDSDEDSNEIEDFDAENQTEDLIEDSGEAELDIF